MFINEVEVTVKVESTGCEREEVKEAECVKETAEEQALRVKEEVTMEEEQEKGIELVQVKREIVCIKEEPHWEVSEWEDSKAALASLYAGHEVKQELVIGTESLQPADAAFKTVTSARIEGTYKQEAGQSDSKVGGVEIELLIAQPGRCSPQSSSVHSEDLTTQKQEIYRKTVEVSFEKGKYVCDICNETFSVKKLLISHIRSHMRRKPFYCAICDKLIHRRSEYAHQQIHTREYRCKFCQKQVAGLCSLIRHERTHTGEKPYVCTICQKQFVCCSSLTKHRRTHSDERPHQCEVCEKRFKEKAQLAIHALIHKGDSAKPYSCQLCAMRFIYRYKLAIHERAHTGEKPHVCKMCDTSFNHKYQLDRHLLVHTGEKPFTCNTCAKVFPVKKDLDRHERSHLGTNPYPCDVCGRAFKHKTNLAAHKLVHTGEKNFLCGMCNKRFTNKRYLVKHYQRIHVAEKRVYTCNICERQFERACYLKRHEIAHSKKNSDVTRTKSNKYVCDICNKEFRNKSNFNRHGKMHRKEQRD